MTTAKGRVLMAGCELAQVEGHRVGLVEHGFTVELERDPEVALTRVGGERFAVVVSWYPLAPGVVGSMVGNLRSRDSLNPGAGLVLLTEPPHLRAAAGLVGRGVSKVLSIAEDPAVLAIVVEQLVHQGLPMVERLPLSCPVTCVVAGVAHRWTSENLSGGGMLVEAANPPPLGSILRFTLELDQGEVVGEAKVVRHVSPGREPVAGFGVRFLSFEGNGKARLLERLRQARASEPE